MMKPAAPLPPSSLSRLRERVGVRAKELRQASTHAEKLLWFRLRNRALLGLKFRRQRAIGNHIADFACLEIGLVVELDGGQHAEQVAYDARREQEMQALGFRTLRFWNHELLGETDAVMEKIRQVAEELTLTPTLSRKREREQDSSPPLSHDGERRQHSRPALATHAARAKDQGNTKP